MRDRTLAAALAVSLALHASVLSLSAEQSLRRAQPPAPLVVWLAEVPAPRVATRSAPAIQPPRTPPRKAAASAPATQDEFRLELIERARGEMRYAKLAREDAWRGDVLVAVRVAPDGRASVSLKESSGQELLDRHGVDAFARAAKSLAVPRALRGRAFELELRASYGRED